MSRVSALSAAALLLAWLPLPFRPLCLLRAVTGVPCPFCGGTTAATAMGDLRPLDALAASPLAVLGAPLWALAPAWRGRVVPQRHRLRLLLVALAASEAWQLVRVLG